MRNPWILTIQSQMSTGTMPAITVPGLVIDYQVKLSGKKPPGEMTMNEFIPGAVKLRSVLCSISATSMGSAWGRPHPSGSTRMVPALTVCWIRLGTPVNGSRTGITPITTSLIHLITIQYPESGADKVLRGGSYSSDWVGVRVSRRGHNPPTFRDSNIGFRCARDP